MLIKIFKTNPMFADFSDEELYLLVNLMEKVTLKSGQMVFVENQQDDAGVYFIEEGIVKITKESTGKGKIIAMFGIGNVFGEMSFLDGQSRSASVIVDEDVLLHKFLPERMKELEQNAPRTAIKLLRVFILKLAARLRLTDEALMDRMDNRIIVT